MKLIGQVQLTKEVEFLCGCKEVVDAKLTEEIMFCKKHNVQTLAWYKKNKLALNRKQRRVIQSKYGVK